MGDRPTTPPAGPGAPDDWNAYYDAVAGLPPRETLLAALERYGCAAGLAIDLGCGDGRDTLELLRRGWRVLAIDSAAEGISRLRSRVPAEAAVRLETRVDRFESAELPACELVNASFSIPHCSPEDFAAMWSRIAGAIRPGGRFAGQLFGVRDEWATKPDGVTRTYHTREEVERLLAPFEIEMLDEVERPGKNALGVPKYWHVFHIVARRK